MPEGRRGKRGGRGSSQDKLEWGWGGGGGGGGGAPFFPLPLPWGDPKGERKEGGESASHTQMQPEGGGGGIAVGERPTSFFFPPFSVTHFLHSAPLNAQQGRKSGGPTLIWCTCKCWGTKTNPEKIGEARRVSLRS